MHLQLVGQGGFATVYRGNQQRFDRTEAVNNPGDGVLVDFHLPARQIPGAIRIARRAAQLAAATLTAALSGAGLAGCGSPDPFTAPACTQLPADAVRAAATDLGTVPEESLRAGPTGAEYGRLPATDPNGFSYWCHWPATSPDENHRSAFTISVGVLQGTDLDATTKAVMDETQGPLLTSTTPGRGRARALDLAGGGKYGSADWICPHIPGYYTTQQLTVDVYRPKHHDHHDHTLRCPR